MKYMIMMFGWGASLADRSPVHPHHRHLRGAAESGEVEESRHRIDPSRATTVRFVDGAPAPTDGPFAELKESLAGYWIIEGTRERAVEIASGRRRHRVPEGDSADHRRAAPAGLAR